MKRSALKDMHVIMHNTKYEEFILIDFSFYEIFNMAIVYNKKI